MTTAGVISKVVRVNGHPACILTSATVAAGNSGGMLVDQRGALLGMVSASVHVCVRICVCMRANE